MEEILITLLKFITVDEMGVDGMGVDEIGVDGMGVDEMGVDGMGVDEMGSRQSGNKPSNGQSH